MSARVPGYRPAGRPQECFCGECAKCEHREAERIRRAMPVEKRTHRNPGRRNRVLFVTARMFSHHKLANWEAGNTFLKWAAQRREEWRQAHQAILDSIKAAHIGPSADSVR